MRVARRGLLLVGLAVSAATIGCGGASLGSARRSPAATPAGAAAGRVTGIRASPLAVVPEGGTAAIAGGIRTPPLTIVRSAASNTLAAPASVEFQLDGARAMGPSRAPVLGSGELDFPSGVGEESIDLGELGKQEPGTEHVVFGPSTVYLQPKSANTSVLPRGKEWVSATLTGSDAIGTNFPSFALQLEGVNPQLLLVELAGGAISAIPTASTSIEGRPARGYVVTVELARALSALSGPAAQILGEAIQSELASLAEGSSRSGAVTSIAVWVDEAGHVVQLRASPPGAGVGTATMTLCCFGLPTEVAIPAPAKVVEIAALTPSGERENNGGGDSDGG